MLEQNKRRQIGAVLMAIWLCGWIGMSLFHGLSHAAHPEDGATQTCAVCHLLNQPVPAQAETRLAVAPAPQFEYVLEAHDESVLCPVQAFHGCAPTRGPPLLLCS